MQVRTQLLVSFCPRCMSPFLGQASTDASERSGEQRLINAQIEQMDCLLRLRDTGVRPLRHGKGLGQAARLK
jgi:hypothetical protein